MGWGDCPAGCGNEHLWELQVTDDGIASFEEWGDDIPKGWVY
jgi:hypothetical protein